MAIALADLLDEKQVILRLRSRKPANAIREIVQVLAHNGKIDMPETFLEQVFARERAHPSVVENGVAFPHARTDLVNQIVLGIGRSRAGIPFGQSGTRAHLIFVIGVHHGCRLQLHRDALAFYFARRSNAGFALAISPDREPDE